MIAALKGIVAEVGTDHLVIDVNGVGYLVYASSRTLQRFGSVGEAVHLTIETHVREDHIHLYGFADRSERDWFKLLTTVQGVGVRVALAIQSVLPPEQLSLSIASGDKASLTRADGVGQKLAARILSELKDKVGALAGEAPVPASAPAAAAQPVPSSHIEDAVSALVNLGYRRPEAFTAVSAANKTLGEAATLEGLIPVALKRLSG